MLRHASLAVCVLILVVFAGSCSPPAQPAVVLPTATTAPPAQATAAPAPATPTPRPTDGSTATPRIDQQAENMTLVGSLKLDPYKRTTHGDVAAYKTLAFVGKSRMACPNIGVDIIDISDPARPQKLAHTPPHGGISMEDMAAIELDGRDVLAIGLQNCAGGQSRLLVQGLELVDISDPRNPHVLSTFRTEAGVHEFSLTRQPDGRVLALLALPDLENQTADDETRRGGTGDLIIVDISDPEQPVQLSEWGILDAPEFGPEIVSEAKRGADPWVGLHSARASADGTRAFLSYWDAGVIILDISDPANPRYLGRTEYGFTDEGNAHSVATSRDGNLLVLADEDVFTRDVMLTSSSFEGGVAVFPLQYSGRLPELEMTGEIAHVGSGCPAGSVPDHPDEEPYLNDPGGKIALIEQSDCPVEQQIARAQQAGATGAIIYGDRLAIDSAGIVKVNLFVDLATGERVTLGLPAVATPRNVGRVLAVAAEPLEVAVGLGTSSWGHLRFFDLSNPEMPRSIGIFSTAQSRNSIASTLGFPPLDQWFSAHNPEIDGNMLYVSWYRDGVRAIDISDPSQPREVGYWTGKGAPTDAPPVNIWGLVAHGDLLLASDLNYGLYILKYDP
jgi:hypothetical protein